MNGWLTSVDRGLQALSQGEMGALQSFLELGEPVLVVFALYITLDSLEERLDSLQSGIEIGVVIFADEVAEELLMAFLLLRPQSGDLAEHGVARLAHELEANVEIFKLLRRRCVERCRLILDVLRARVLLVVQGLLAALLLLAWRRLSRRARLQSPHQKLEDFERVWSVWGCGCDSKGVASR